MTKTRESSQVQQSEEDQKLEQDISLEIRQPKSVWIWFARLFVGLGLLALLLWKIDFSGMLTAISQANSLMLYAAVGASIASIFATSLTSYYLINSFEKVSYWSIFKASLCTVYLSLAVPSSLGSLLGRPWLLYAVTNEAIKPDQGAVITILENLIGNSRRATISLIGLVILLSHLTISTKILFGISVLSYLVMFSILSLSILSKRFCDVAIWANWKLMRVVPFPSMAKRFGKLFSKSIRSIHTSAQVLIERPKKILIFGILWAGLNLATETVRLWLLLQAFGHQSNLFRVMFTRSLAYSPTILPISVGGVGVAELSGTMAFTSLLNIPQGTALAVTVLDRVLSMYVIAAIGAFLISFLEIPEARSHPQ